MLKTNLMENWDDGQFPRCILLMGHIWCYIAVHARRSSNTLSIKWYVLCAESYAGRNYGNVRKSVGGYWTWLVRYQLVSDRLTVRVRQYLTTESGRIMHIVKLLQTWLIETTVGNRGVIIYLGQGGLRSLSASPSLNMCHHSWNSNLLRSAHAHKVQKLFFLHIYLQICLERIFLTPQNKWAVIPL